MKKTFFALLVFIVARECAFCQNKLLTETEIRESYDLGSVKIPIHAYLKIKSQFMSDWLSYRMEKNSEYSRNDWYDVEKGMPCNPFKFILRDTINYKRYDMLFSIREWPDSSYSKFDIQKLDGLGNYYLVEKRGNVFRKQILEGVIYSDSVKALPDTIKVNAYSEQFPYDDRFLYYYDKEKDQLWNISGNIEWNNTPYRSNLPQYYILTRLAQYDVKMVQDYRIFLNSKKNSTNIYDSLLRDSKHRYYIAESSLLSEGRLLIRTPFNSKNVKYDKLIEVIFYTLNPLKTGDKDGKTMMEYRYSIRSFIEKSNERTPAIRKLSNEEKQRILNSNMRFFVEFYFSKEDET